jgi:penicillin-binding protein 1A
VAGKRRQGERVEPGRDGFLGFGMKEGDRAGGSAPARGKRRKSRGFFDRGGAKERGRTDKRPRRGVLSRFIRRTVYWCVVVGVISTAALSAVVAYYWAKLPPTSEWTLPKRSANVRIVSMNGEVITNRGDTAGSTLTLDEMPPYLPEAVIAIEDRRFYYHFGIDPIGLARAMITNLRAGSVVQGGSTLTQQLAKNLFLKPERTFERKIQEVILAVWLEASLSKKQILELYLNRVYLGAGAYGVDAAARRYFGKSARAVTLAEAATLAGLLKAPGNYSPLLDPEAAEGRTQVVLTAMRDAGYISDREASLAMSVPIKPVRDVAGGSGRYVADWVMDILPAYVGAVDQDIVVDTTIDLKLQGEAASALSDTLDEDGAKFGASQGAFVAMDSSGAVKALVGGRDYAISPFNRAVDAHRQPGSAFKPFVYLTALERGLVPETVRIDQPVAIRGWRPENYSRKYLGPVSLQTALALSLNTISVQLTAELGAKAVAATARRLGITSPLTATPSIALGTSEVTLLELTGAFVPFANGGNGVIPHVVKRITAADGKILYERAGPGPGQVVDPVYVGMMNAMLKDTLARGTGRKAAIADWPAAGKTGTSQDFRDAWFIGYTADLIAGVWFGNDDSKPTKKASGSNLPAIAWSRFMSEALQGLAVVDLPGNYRSGDQGRVEARASQEAIPSVPATAAEGGAAAAIARAPAPSARPAGTSDAVAALASGDPAWQVDEPAPSGQIPPADIGAGPLPPGDVGGTPAAPAPAPKKKSFLKRLFGG